MGTSPAKPALRGTQGSWSGWSASCAAACFATSSESANRRTVFRRSPRRSRTSTSSGATWLGTPLRGARSSRSPAVARGGPPPRRGERSSLPLRLTQLWLAVRAEMGAPSPDDDAGDRRAAAVTRLPGSPEDLNVHLLGTLLPVGIHVVSEAGSSPLDSPPNDVPDRLVEPSDCGCLETPCRRVGPDSGGEQRLVRVDVSQARDAPLVEEHRFHRRPAASQHRRQGFDRERRVEWLGAELSENLVVT